ncbi:vesicle-associated protein 1-3-like [Typha angustifolia]|uniref:vesicle-associated protein 1-3-like n=1 Tax=Typha angustifolia TaxID=59011 RepID=UPI003C2CD4C7
MSNTFLRIQPSELKIPFELKKNSSCSMQLTNKTDQYVAFKVKTTNPRKYVVRPNNGIVLPGTTCTITVTMQAQKDIPPDYHCKDKFLIQSVLADYGATAKDITPEMFNKTPDKVVEEFKLRVVYIPANPPSPVPEEAEEESSPRSSNIEDEGQSSSLFDAGTRYYEETSREKAPEALPMISKLSKEKANVVEKNQKLQEELEQLRKEARKRRGFSSMFVLIMSLLGILVGYLIKKT